MTSLGSAAFDVLSVGTAALSRRVRSVICRIQQRIKFLKRRAAGGRSGEHRWSYGAVGHIQNAAADAGSEHDGADAVTRAGEWTAESGT